MDYIIARLKERSTWQGIIILLGVAGVKISPELTQNIVTSGLTLIATIEVFRKERPSK